MDRDISRRTFTAGGVAAGAVLASLTGTPSKLCAGILEGSESLNAGIEALWKKTVETGHEHCQMYVRYTDGSGAWMRAEISDRDQDGLTVVHHWERLNRSKRIDFTFEVHTHPTGDTARKLLAKEKEYDSQIITKSDLQKGVPLGNTVSEPLSSLDLVGAGNYQFPSDLPKPTHIAGAKTETGIYIQRTMSDPELRAKFGQRFNPIYLLSRREYRSGQEAFDAAMSRALSTATIPQKITALTLLRRRGGYFNKARDANRLMAALEAGDSKAGEEVGTLIRQELFPVVTGPDIFDTQKAVVSLFEASGSSALSRQYTALQQITERRNGARAIVEKAHSVALTRFRFFSAKVNGVDTAFIRTPLGSKLFADLQAASSAFGEYIYFVPNDSIAKRTELLRP